MFKFYIKISFYGIICYIIQTYIKYNIDIYKIQHNNIIARQYHDFLNLFIKLKCITIIKQGWLRFLRLIIS